MRPRERRESGKQDLFRSRLDQIIDMNHALVKLARAIDWHFLEERFGAVYSDTPGQPPPRHPALAHAVMAPLICWSFSNSMFRYLLVDHAVPAMWRSLAAARLSAD